MQKQYQKQPKQESSANANVRARQPIGI